MLHKTEKTRSDDAYMMKTKIPQKSQNLSNVDLRISENSIKTYNEDLRLTRTKSTNNRENNSSLVINEESHISETSIGREKPKSQSVVQRKSKSSRLLQNYSKRETPARYEI